MEIKIKLPHNVRVTCPTPESAIIILRSLHFRSAYADLVGRNKPLNQTATIFRPNNQIPNSYPNGENARTYSGPPVVSGRPAEGEGFQAYAGADEHDDFDAPVSIPPATMPSGSETEVNSSEEASEEELEEDEEDSSDDGSEDEVDDDGPDTERRREEFDDFDAPDEDDEEEEGNEEVVEVEVLAEGEVRKPNTRSRHAAELIVDAEESGEVQEQVKQIFLSKAMGERTRRVFDFIQTRLVFTTKDVQKYAKEELGIKKSKKNKRKLRDSLKTIEKNGFIEKTAKGEWRKVS